jgi:hypothetical protein
MNMANTHRISIIGAVIVCFVSAQGNATLFASEDTCSLRDAPASPSLTTSTPAPPMSTSEGFAEAIAIDDHPGVTDVASTPVPAVERAHLTLDAGLFAVNPSLGPVAHSTFNLGPTEFSALTGQVHRGQPYRLGRNGSIAALMIGAVATITGAAILVYAHRPDCTTDQFAGGCGYGTKVIGGAVLAGGVVGLFVGALTWR